jgi:hypothetical protein
MHKRMYNQERGGVSPPWLGNTSGVLEKSSTVQRHATDNQERGGRKPPWFAEVYSQCHRPVTRNTTDASPATAIATMFAGTLAAVSRTFAVSPLQMRFRTPRRAHARRSCLNANE